MSPNSFFAFALTGQLGEVKLLRDHATAMKQDHKSAINDRQNSELCQIRYRTSCIAAINHCFQLVPNIVQSMNGPPTPVPSSHQSPTSP